MSEKDTNNRKVAIYVTELVKRDLEMVSNITGMSVGGLARFIITSAWAEAKSSGMSILETILRVGKEGTYSKRFKHNRLVNTKISDEIYNAYKEEAKEYGMGLSRVLSRTIAAYLPYWKDTIVGAQGNNEEGNE